MKTQNQMRFLVDSLDTNTDPSLPTRLRAWSRWFFGACLLAILFLAKNGLASDLIATFNPPGAPAPDLATYGIGFELFYNGLYWWQGDGVCDGLGNNNNELGYKGSASSSVNPFRPVMSCNLQISGAVRDDLYFYLAANKRIFRKPLGGSASSALIPPLELPTI